MKFWNGSVLDSLEAILEGVVQYFRQVLSSSSNGDILDLRHLLSQIITDDDNTKLLAIPLEEELTRAMKFIPTDSYPGLDGFRSRF